MGDAPGGPGGETLPEDPSREEAVSLDEMASSRRDGKRSFLTPKRCVCLRCQRRTFTLFCRSASGNQLGLFPSSIHAPRRGQAGLRGQRWPRQRRPAPAPRGVPTPFLSSQAGARQELGRCWLSRETQALEQWESWWSDPGVLREKRRPVLLRRRPPEQRGRWCGCPEPTRSAGSRSSSLPGRCLLPGELWIEKSITGMAVSDDT